ncbi:MAG: acetate/propionate family kinase [Gemmataceae bacterium]|nr:acetate/propionate family kinase [Gemmataceae bacterium]
MKVVLLNAGSSSLKCSLVEGGRTTASAGFDWAGPATRYRFTGPDGVAKIDAISEREHGPAVRRFLADLVHQFGPGFRSEISAVGHRVVHGGAFTSSVRIDDAVRDRIASLGDLAPLHNPPSLRTLAAAEAELPGAVHVAVFDTAFHATLPPAAYTYPLPHTWTNEWGIRRFGFHGLSHDYCSGRTAEMLGKPVNELRAVICHLGHGCSASAFDRGRCVDTTMGFTPLDGLMMATRSGAVDPGIVLHVQERHGLSPADVERSLNRESGLLGVSGISADMREVLAAAESGHEAARLAVDMYARRVRQAIGAFAVTMGGIDALVFTAGVGENSAPVREAVCRGLECLGLQLDREANATARPDACISRGNSAGAILVVATREEVVLYREVLSVLDRLTGLFRSDRAGIG